MPGLVGVAEVATMLGVPVWKVYELASAGVVPVVRLGAKRIMFSPEQVQAFIDSGGRRSPVVSVNTERVKVAT